MMIFKRLLATMYLVAATVGMALAQPGMNSQRAGGTTTPRPAAPRATTPPRTTTPRTSSTSASGLQAVDLGLSVKWASCNIGASKPEEYGDYYAWGETITKTNYDWSTYRYCSDSEGNSFTKYNTYSEYGPVDNKRVLDLSDDVANKKLGGKWRIPTLEEWDELCNNCLWEWTTVNGKNGYKVTSYENGKSIFLPAAGYRGGTDLNDAGSNGHYWSSSLDTDYPYLAWYVEFYSDSVYGVSSYRCYGLSVRPVTE